MLQKDSNAPASLEHEEAECSVHQLIDQMLSLKAKLNQLSNFQDDFKVDGINYNDNFPISISISVCVFVCLRPETFLQKKTF